MSKGNLTLQFEKYLMKYTNKQGVFFCPEVTIGWFGNERVDYLTYDTNNIFRCYEIKTSKSDFYSKCKKSFIGNYNYYVMPRKLYLEVEKDIPEKIGVLVENKIGNKIYEYSPLVSIKQSKKQDLKIDKDVLKDSLIRSLHREYRKNIKEIHITNGSENTANIDKAIKDIKQSINNGKTLITGQELKVILEYIEELGGN